MSYRSDKEALLFRREALEQELAEVRESLDPLADRERELERDLDQLRRDEAEVRQRVKLPMLDRVVVANPCPKSWDEMRGDDRVRFCGHCQKNVFNLIAMTRAEADELLRDG